jgi:hypothetical protein
MLTRSTLRQWQKSFNTNTPQANCLDIGLECWMFSRNLKVCEPIYRFLLASVYARRTLEKRKGEAEIDFKGKKEFHILTVMSTQVMT